MRKGQLEFIVVLGILLVVVIVAFYAMQGGTVLPSSVPKGVYDEQREISETIKNIIRNAADKTLRDMMMHGGYLEDRGVAGVSYEDVAHTDFLLGGVPYWQQCNNVMYPDIRDVKLWMEASMEKMLRESIDDVELLYGNRAVFDRDNIDVNINILGINAYEPDMLDITVNMPTKVRDYSLPGDLYPYRVKVDTKFGKIYSFGRDFADASAENRYFDIFTITAIYFSQELENTHTKLPTFGVLTQCGEVLYRSPQQINTYLLEMLEYVMASTLWWQKMVPTGDEKAFAIEDLNGEAYPGLDISTMMADGFLFNLFDFVFVTNFDMPSSNGHTIPVCTEVYNKGYNFNYPFVVRVKDPYTGYGFNFASMVGVRDRGDGVMVPSECGAVQETMSECRELACYGRVRVMNDLGEPMPNSFVVFGGCPIGETDENGYVDGPIQCGLREIFIYQTSEYEFLKRNVSATSINSTYVLNPVPEIRVHFREVEIKRHGYVYRHEEEYEYEVIECDVCKKGYCSIQEELIYECNIRLIDREYAFVELDNGHIKLPVTNTDMSAADPECRDNPDCELCEELTQELRENPNSPGSAEQAREACRKCVQGCVVTPVESVVVNYLPTGYAYSVDARMHDPLSDFMIKGGFLYDFNLSRNDTEFYAYIPRRAGDRSGYIDYDMGNSEKQCLAQAIQKCEIDPVSTEKYVSTTLVLSPEGCTCSYLRSIAEGCGAPRTDIYCDCPADGSYPSECDECEGDDSCTTCCDKPALLEHLKTIEESCGIRVICT
jgi:hypothetical protein